MSELLEFFQTENAGDVAETLDFWLYECSIDEAPDADEVAVWCEILEKRGSKFVKLADMCRQWLKEETA